MKKLFLATAGAIALFGVAACSDTDNTTTQAVEPSTQTTPVPSDPAMAPAPQAPMDGTQPMQPATPAPSE